MTSYLLVATIVLALAAGALYYVFRKEPIGPLPEFRQQWRRLLRNEVVFYALLDRDGKQRFQERMRYFLQRVRITGIGTEVNELDRVLVAASGIIPTFGFEQWNQYPKLREVLLYPTTFYRETFATVGAGRNIAGMVGGGYLNGKLLLSQQALRRGFATAGRDNTGIHEFTHLLDKADGDTEGIPGYFLDHQYLIPWVEMMRGEMEAIERGDSDIDTYATTNKAEFFAVAAEYFFNQPAAFAQNHPKLFALMERIFHQDLDGDGGIGTVDHLDPVARA